MACCIAGCALPNSPAAQSEHTVKRGAGEQDVSYVKSDNTAMNAAIQEARRTVPQFLAAMQAAKPGQRFTVKMRVSDGTVTEHMWLDGLSYDGKRFSGTLEDDPFQVKGYHKGQTMTVAPNDISDWIIFEGKKRTGAYTEKVLEQGDLKTSH